MNQVATYLTLKTGQAPKTSIKACGMIGYRILTDSGKSDVFIRLETNEGGYFSNELVPFSRIEACIVGLQNSTSIPAKTFRAAFVGKSNNNAGFLCSCLRAEGLMTHDPERGYSHQITGDWSKWKADMLSLEGEPFTIAPSEEKKPASKASAQKSKDAVSAGESAESGHATGKRKPRTQMRGK